MAWLDSFVSFVTFTISSVLTNAVVAAIVLLIGFIIGRVVGNLAKRILGEFGMNRFIYQFIGLHFSLEDVLSSFIEYGIYFITLVLALNQLKVGEIVFNSLAFIILFFILLSIFLSLRDFFPNLVAGIVISSKSIIKKGDHVKIDDIEGKVIETSFHAVKIELSKNETVLVPNRTVLKNKIVQVK